MARLQHNHNHDRDKKMARQFAKKTYIHVETVEWRLEVTIRHVLYNMQCAEQIIKTKEKNRT